MKQLFERIACPWCSDTLFVAIYYGRPYRYAVRSTNTAPLSFCSRSRHLYVYIYLFSNLGGFSNVKQAFSGLYIDVIVHLLISWFRWFLIYPNKNRLSKGADIIIVEFGVICVNHFIFFFAKNFFYLHCFVCHQSLRVCGRTI